jgi:hypothetical protein
MDTLMRLFPLITIFAVLAGFLQSSIRAADAPVSPLSSHFADQPADSLVRQLRPGPPSASDPAAGLVVAQKSRWVAGLQAVVIDTTITNPGQQPRRVASPAVADWTFRLRDPQDAGYGPLAHRNDTWYGSTYWTGPDWTRVGKDWHHPGEQTTAVRRFTCPKDGRVTITGRAHKAHVAPSDGVRLAVRHGQKTVWQAEIGGEDAKGVEPNLQLDVRAGDSIRFVVHKRGQIFCDTTHWDPVIAYAGGPAFQASKSFSTTRQGLDGWSYEMESGGRPDYGLPRLLSFGPELTIRDSALAADQTVALCDRDALPLWVLADGAGQSGVVAALCGPGPWRLRAATQRAESLRLEILPGDEKAEFNIRPGETIVLPAVLLAAYSGPQPAAISRLGQLLRSHGGEPELAELRRRLDAALARAGNALDPDLQAAAKSGAWSSRAADLDLWLMVQAEWHREDKLDQTPPPYAAATARHLGQAQKLLADLQTAHGRDFLHAEAVQLERLAKATQGATGILPVPGAGTGETPVAPRAHSGQESMDRQRSLYQQVRCLKRRIALSNPLLDFDKLLLCKRVPTSYSHLVMQYYGWRARPGGGIFLLDEPGRSLAARDILGGRLERGNVLEPRLSFDGRKIVFSYVEIGDKTFDPSAILNDRDEGFYHIYTVNVDGTDLKQVTSGPFDDVTPTWLPDGGIAFCSTRRRGYARCFGGQFSRRWHVYTLHRVEADGSRLRQLSFHDTNEWFPAVSNTGHILYARWDYIDRDAVTHQNLWATRPDGTNPVAVWGNATASPHCTFQLQPIPGTDKVVFAASAHHSIAGGSIAIVDPTVANNGQAAITRITPEIPFPEAESRDIREYYDAPWPLSEKYFLVGYSPTPLVWEPGANGRNALGIYLLDAFGNRELIYRDPEIGSSNACPLRPQPAPPALPSILPDDAPPVGEMLLTDVYQGLGDVPRGTVKDLRIVQIFPKTTHVADAPPVGKAREENGRAILGTVPVEPDGSARFLVPAGKPILFQALDADGLAVQTMRTITYLQPGEKISCVGCHENRMSSPLVGQAEAAALRRAPSPIDPGPLGGRPFSYVEVVQPVLDQHCVKCHRGPKPDGGIDLTGAPQGGFSTSYLSLCGDADFWGGGTNLQNAAKALVPRFGGRNQVQVTPPGGMYGARGSRLMKMLRQGHEKVVLTSEELRRLAAWIDLNAIFYGVNLPEEQARQLRGEPVPMPEIQ